MVMDGARAAVKLGLEQIPTDGLQRLKHAFEETPEVVLMNGSIWERVGGSLDVIC